MKKTKQKILKVAANLFSEFGFLGTSMESIAKKLKISKAALYHHFKSKKEIYLKVLEESFEGLIENIEKKISGLKSKREIIFKTIEGYLEFGFQEKNLIKSLLLNLSKKDLEIQNCILKIKNKINLRFKKYLKDIPKEKIFLLALLGAMDRMILEASFSRKKINPQKVTFQILKIFPF